MKIKISDKRKISEIQEMFHLQFPFLKIEFFRLSSSIVQPLKKNSAINPETKIGLARSVHSGEIYIEPQQSVCELKKKSGIGMAYPYR